MKRQQLSKQHECRRLADVMPTKAATGKAKAQTEAGPEAAQASRCLQTALQAGVSPYLLQLFTCQ